MFKYNPLNLTDGYKVGHKAMLAPNTDYLYGTWIPRSTKYAPKGVTKILSAGQQLTWMHIHDQFEEYFFKQPIDVAKKFASDMGKYLGLPYDGQHFEELHKLGYLPIRVKALPEGIETSPNIPHQTFVNTKPGFAWLTLYLETPVSNLSWKTSTNATTALQYRRNTTEWVMKTDSDNAWFIDYACHDFAARGLDPFTTISSGLAHAMSFIGSDTLIVIDAARYYYGVPEDEVCIASVNASEHSVTCTGLFYFLRKLENGELNHEIDTYYSYDIPATKSNRENPDLMAIAEWLNLRRWLEIFPVGILSVVSDTFDLFRVITEILPRLKDEIMARDGKLVTRPNCYSEDTLFLTNYGWKNIDAIKQGALVAQVEEDGSYTFVQPTKIVDEQYEGEMYKYTDFHGKMDLLVTPNHRMVYKQFDNWKVDYAENCKPNNYTKKFIRSAKAVNKNKKLSFIERLNIAFQADGSYQTGVTSSIRFSFSKIRKIQRLENLLKENNIEYTTYNLGDGKIEFNIKIDKSQVSKDFNWVNINNLCSNWCQEFIEELSHWDSSIRSEGRIKFDTTNTAVISTVELIALSAGYGCLVSEYEDERSELFSKVYTANILLDNKLGGQSIQVEKTNYKGNIVCVTVPTGKIVVKRNRCTMVCGNSGNPVDITCGVGYDVHINPFKIDRPDYSIDERKGVIELLWDIFGGTVSKEGYKVLDSHIGSIYGDSITLDRQVQIYERLADKGFASTNIVLGVGSYTYQYNTRDTYGFAAKGAWFQSEGIDYNIYKDPATDNGTKKSLKGLVAVHKDENNEYFVKTECTPEEESDGELQLIYENGKFYNQITLSEIREKIKLLSSGN